MFNYLSRQFLILNHFREKEVLAEGDDEGFGIFELGYWFVSAKVGSHDGPF